MTAATRLASVFVFLLFALAAGARAQTVPVEVATGDGGARFSAAGKVRMMQVEVYGPGGEMVFVSGFVEGGAVQWPQRDQLGRRVADGVYTAAVTTVDASGELRKRVERVVVGPDAQAAGFSNAPNPTPQAPAALTGEGTAGKLAKFTSAYQLVNSVVTESAGKVGVGTAAPTAILEINGPQPGPQPATGTDATPLLKTVGGKGGNTTTAGEIAGRGASITLLAGPGGNAHQDSTNGSGGSITLQGGLKGTGGTGGVIGNVLIAPLGGNVGIGLGTGIPTARLTVKGTGVPHLVSVENTSATVGAVAVFGKNLKGHGVYGVGGPNFAGVYGEPGNLGYGVWGRATGFGFGVVGESTGSGRGVVGQSSSGEGVFGKSTTGVGIRGEGPDGEGVVGTGRLAGVEGISSTGVGVLGKSTTGYAGKFEGVVGVTGTVEIGGTAFFGSDARQMIILHTNGYGIGVQTSTHYSRTNGGFAWYKGGLHTDTANSPGTGGTRLMKLDSAGNLQVLGTVSSASDRNVKSNFAAVNPREVLDKLNALPIETWSYKADGGAVRHIGPVAQDFKAAFNLGADDKTIATVDADGVTMAAVQGLYQLMLEKEKRNEELARTVERQGREIEELRSQLGQVRRSVKRRRAARR